MVKRVPKIARRAWLLAQQYHIDVFSIEPTGGDGRITEEDVLRIVQARMSASQESVAVAPVEKPVAEAAPAEEAPAAEPVAEAASAEEAPAAEPAAEVTLAEEAPAAEPVAEAAPVEETPAAEPVAEATPTEEAPAAESVAEATPAEEAPAEEVLAEPVAEETEERQTQMAIVAKTVSKEESVNERAAEPERETISSFDSEAYRHTDVIIPRTATAPDGTPMTVSMSFDASSVVRLHTMIKENGEALGVPQVTVNDMILFAVAKLLKKNKALNAHFLGDKIRYFDGVHLGFAVDTDHGMEIPVVFDADKLSLYELTRITEALTRGTRSGKISSEKAKNCASFTVSDLGALGVEYFTPNLKAPQTGVLGVCALQRRVKEVGGKDVFYSCIPLSLTFDPRALDTTSAAKFLRDLCVSLENFELLLLK